MRPIKCTNCEQVWEDESFLPWITDAEDGEEVPGCDVCHTDGNLMDITEDEYNAALATST